MRLILGNSKISTWQFLFTLFLVLKLALDFLTPFRSIAYLVSNVVIYLFLFLYYSQNRKLSISKSTLFELIVLFVFTSSQIILEADISMLIKIISFYINYKIIRLLLSSINYITLEKIAKKTIVISIIMFFITFIYSYLTGIIGHREFGFFEHVNLLGNIIVFLVLGVVYFNMSFKYKLAIVIMGLLSMSTGSLLISMLVFLPIRRINFKTILIYFSLAISFFIVFYILLEKFNPDLHNKIFGIFEMFKNQSFSSFVKQVEDGVPLQKINADVKSSLVWRIYAWIKYYIAIGNSAPLYLIFGHGLMGYSTVWEGVMPHNDYILILYDFGLIFYLFLIPIFFKFIKVSVNNKVILFIGLLFLLRLSVENVIYSYYTFYIFVFQFALILSHYAQKKSLHNSNVSLK